MKKVMFFTTIISSVLLFLYACNDAPKEAAAGVLSQDSLIRRGDYLVSTIGCDDCHTPKKMGAHGPEPDMDYRFAGYLANRPIGPIDSNALKNGWLLFNMDISAAVGPWGISYSANLSSDATGIGNWTESQFIKAIRLGKIKGMEEGRSMLPPMPWRNFAKLTDTDLRAMFAYFKSTKPIENRVPAPKSMQELMAR